MRIELIISQTIYDTLKAEAILTVYYPKLSTELNILHFILIYYQLLT